MKTVVIALALATTLSACTSGSTHKTSPSPSVTGVPASPAASPSSPASPAAPSPTPSPAAPAITVVQTRFAGGFSTPSGNIVCQLEAGYALCKAKDQPWKDVPKTERCDKGWRTTIELRIDSPASLRGNCYDAVFERITPPLPYGHALQVGGMRCVSLQTELQCLVVGTHRGFVVNRNSYRLTAPTSGLAIAPAPASVAGTVIVVPAGFHGGFGFESGGLQCDQDSESVSCLVNGAASWKPPPRKPPCGDSDGDPSPTVEVRKGVGSAFVDCRFDANAAGPDLTPGHGIRIGLIECLARQPDLTCTDRRTGHGFVVSEKRFRAF